MTGERVSPRYTAADWFTASACGTEITAPALRAQPRRVRPPGDGAPSIHTLLPHVLRI
ncbi:MAG: hypothetical protein WCO99_13855 [Planctomycetota bacterium]